MKEGLANSPHVELHFCCGMTCFEIKGMKPEEVVKRLLERKIVASTTPDRISYARLACSIVNTSEEVEKTLRAIRQLA